MQRLKKELAMRTKLLYLLVGLIVFIVLFIIWLFKRPCKKWERPVNVPISAVWQCGCDGGNWMKLVDIRDDTIRLRIYRDWNGKLILDADFVSENCNDLPLTKTNWSEYVDYFDGTKIYTKIQVGSCYCRLIPIFPAYYEEKQKRKRTALARFFICFKIIDVNKYNIEK